MKLLKIFNYALCLIILILIPGLSKSSTYSWVGTTSTWADLNNWEPANGDPDGYPIAGDNVIIDGGTVTPILPSDLTINNFTLTNAKSIDLNGKVLTINGYANFISGTVTSSVAPIVPFLIIVNSSLSTEIGSLSDYANFEVPVKITSADVMLYSGNNFHQAAQFIKSGGIDQSWIGGNTFQGPTLIKTTSTSGHLSVGYNGGTDLFEGEVSIINEGTKDIFVSSSTGNVTTFEELVTISASSSGSISFACNHLGAGGNVTSTVNFNSGFTISSTGTGNVRFGYNATSQPVINVEDELSVTNFQGVELYLRWIKMSEGGNININIPSGTSYVIIRNSELNSGGDIYVNNYIAHIVNSTFKADINISANEITNVRECVFEGNTEITKRGLGNSIWYGDNIFGSELNPLSLKITSLGGLLKLANDLGDIYFSSVDFLSNNGKIEVANGNNNFNNTVTIKNTGTADVNIGVNSNCNTIFEEKVTVNCNTSGSVFFANLSNCSITFNKGIDIVNTGTAAVRFAPSTSYNPTIIMNGKIVASYTVGGYLFIRNVQQPFNPAISEEEQENSISIGGTGTLSFYNCSLDVGGEYTSYRIANIQESVFKRKTTFTTTGSTSQDTWIGGNTFGDPDYGQTAIDPDHITTFNINNTSMLFMAYTNGDNYYQPVVFNNYTTNFYIRQGINNFYQTAVFNNHGVQNIVIGVGQVLTEINFKKHVILNTTNTGRIFPAYQGTAKVKFEKGVTISNTGSGGTVFAYAIENQEINILGKIAVQNFTSGKLSLRKFSQSGTETNEIELTGTGILEILNCAFNSSSNFTAPEISNVRNSTFVGNTIFTKTGTAATSDQDYWIGENVFGSPTTSCSSTVTINCNSGFLRLCHLYGDIYYSKVVINTLNNGYLELANGETVFNCLTTINNNGSRLWLANLNGTVIFKDDLVLNSSGGTGITIGNLTYAPSQVTFDPDKGVKVGTGGFTGGNLTLTDIIQTGLPSNDVRFTDQANQLQIQNCTLSGGVFEAPRLVVSSSIFNGVSSFYKSNNINVDAYFNGNTFNYYVNIINNSTHSIIMCHVANQVETYNSEVKYVINSSGNISTGYAGTCEYFGDVEYVKGENATGYIFVAHTGINKFRENIKTNFAFGHGNSNGTNYFIGSGDQTIEYTGDLTTKPSPMYGKLAIDKPSGKLLLQMPITIVFEAIFVKGNIVTSTDNVLTFYNNTSTHSGASDLSFIEGPASKRNSGAFTFPIGKNYYRPISIGSQIYSGAIMTAEYFEDSPINSDNIKDPLNAISNCEYWTVSRDGQSADVNVTLHWLGSTCTAIDQVSMQVAWFDNINNEWVSIGAENLTGNNEAGSVTSNLVKTGIFTYGMDYIPRILIDTKEIQENIFTVSGAGLSSGPLQSSTGGIDGEFIFYPSLPSSGSTSQITIDVTGDEDNEVIKIQFEIDEYSNISKVGVDLNNSGKFLPLSDDYYEVDNSQMNQIKILKFKNKNESAIGLVFSTNLEGIVFDKTITSIFQIYPLEGIEVQSLSIFDVSGNLIKEVESSSVWDGTNNGGLEVEQGVYSYKLEIFDLNNISYTYYGQLILKE